MPAANTCPKHLKLITILLLLVLSSVKVHSQNISLNNAFAHNDYWHKRPLFDALDNGYTHVEADVYLRHGSLIVSHLFPMLHPDRNLEALYLKPLHDRLGAAGQTMPQSPVMLMIDIKSEAVRTYAELEVLLEKYRPMLSGYENGKFVQRQVTVVLSGHKPSKVLESQQSRLAFMDEDLMNIQRDTLPANVYQMASCRYSKLVSWTGRGDLPAAEKQRLCAYVDVAHKFGKKVRLWASPENKTVWKALLNCGVDLINTDKLVELRNFLLIDCKKQTASSL